METFLDPKSWELPHYLAVGGLAVVLLAVVLYFLGGSRVKVSGAVVSSVACLGLGVALGLLSMAALGYRWQNPQEAGSGRPVPVAPGTGGGGGGTGGGSPQDQLAQLVTKLDVLTDKPLTIRLDSEQKKRLSEQLRGLESKEQLSEEEARKVLGAIEDVVKGDKEVLETAGYHWPGSPSPPSIPPMAKVNLFKVPVYGDHLKALQQRLGKAE